jgi:hypothetical protein
MGNGRWGRGGRIRILGEEVRLVVLPRMGEITEHGGRRNKKVSRNIVKNVGKRGNCRSREYKREEDKVN